MKTNKLLKSSMSVALALTISSITAQAWPTNSNIAKADFGDTAASQKTKTELNEIINKKAFPIRKALFLCFRIF